MTAQFNRRSLLRLAPAALAVGCASPVMAIPVAETPVMALFHEWDAMYRHQNSDAWSGVGDDEYDTACDARRALEKQIWATPAENMRDVLAKITVQTNYGSDGMPDERQDPAFWSEARALIAA